MQAVPPDNNLAYLRLAHDTGHQFMPKLKPSKGEAKLTTIYGEAFVAWLWKEVENMADWNRDNTIVRTGECIRLPFAIFVRCEKHITIYSKLPVVEIHPRLKIRMGDGKLELT